MRVLSNCCIRPNPHRERLRSQYGNPAISYARVPRDGRVINMDPGFTKLVLHVFELLTASCYKSAEDKRAQPSEVSLEEYVRGTGEETEPEQGNSERTV